MSGRRLLRLCDGGRAPAWRRRGDGDGGRQQAHTDLEGIREATLLRCASVVDDAVHGGQQSRAVFAQPVR